ncbi:MAG: DUF4892 domain-containing protein [Halomonadaceae bacterium]|nr:MAG: DUF4892 domain-containing protein [Halomonadaceae bacterium]
MALPRMFGLFLLLLPWSSVAQDLGLPVFSQGTLERSETLPQQDTRVYTGAIREVRGEIATSDRIRKELSGEKRLISTGRNFSVSEVQGHYAAALQEREATVLFSCEGRSCGSSNVWANRVFGESRLYGRDDEQSYQVSAWRDASNRIQLNTLYIVQRGNRQVYVHEQAFVVPEGRKLPGVELDNRRVFGPIVIPWRNHNDPDLAITEDQLAQILDLAEEYPRGKLYLLGYAPLMEGSLDSLIATIDEATGKLAKRLQDAGLEESRLRRKSLGPLVSVVAEGRPRQRVEVMLVREESDD